MDPVSPSGPPAPLDGVRSKLRARGYLDGRIERFVLRDLIAAGDRRPRVSRAALKASAIGGPLFGALLTVAAAAANRPLLRAADLLLLAAYFTALTAPVLLVLNLAAAGLVSAVAGRRGPRSGDVLAAGLLVGLPVLAYVGLLWSGRERGAGVGSDLLFLAAALVTTLLVAWLAGLVSVAGIAGRTREVPDRLRRTTLRLVVAGLSLGSLVLLLGLGRRDATRIPQPRFDVADRSTRVLLVGVDGLDRPLIDAFTPRGAAGGLRQALDQGAYFALRRRSGAEPPEVWTTLLTGTPPGTHGVDSAGSRRLPGVSVPLRRRSGPLPLQAALRMLLPARTVPASSTLRTVRTLWEIVALRRPAVAVAWWATWPAVADSPAGVATFVVTDRVLAKLLSGEPGDRDTLPASLFGRLETDFDGERRRLREVFDLGLGRDFAEPLAGWLWESYLIDAYSWSVTRLLTANPEVRAAFVYLPGLDILRYRLRGRGNDGIGAAVETQQALEAYLNWLDRTLGAPADLDPAWTRVLVGDPGRASESGSQGFVLVLGPAAEPGCRGPELLALDLAPLVLDLLGFPASREMGGRAPDRCLAAGPPAAEIATYGRRQRGAEVVEGAFDEQMLERLRSLGYVK